MSSGIKTRPLRHYEPVWRELRAASDHVCILEKVSEHHVSRVQRMVSKEKDMDQGFKIMNEVERFKLKFEYSPERKELKISLVSRFGLVDVIG